MSTTRIYAAIEGVAQNHTTDDAAVLRRFSTGPFSGDTEGVYIECIPAGEFPSEVASEIDPRNGTYTTGGVSLRFAAVPAVIASLMDGRQVAVGTLTADLTRTGTSADTDVVDGSLTGTLLVVEREVVYFGTHTGAGTYTIVRGQASTRPAPHSASITDGHPALLLASTLPVSRQRLLTLGRVLDDGAQSDYTAESTLWRGVLTGVSMAGSHVRVDASPVWSLLDDATICNNLFVGLSTGAPGVYKNRGRPAASSLSLTLVVDKAALYRRNRYTYDADEDITTITLSQIPVGGTAEISREDLEKSKEVREVHPCTSTSDGVYPPSRNAVTLCLQILLTTAHGENVGDGGEDYDMGVEDLGVGIRADLVDIASFESVRDRLGDLAVMQSMYLGRDGKPEKVKSLLTRLLRPLGCTIATNLTGQITCVQLRDNLPVPTTTLDSSNLLTNPEASGAHPVTTPRPDLSYDALNVTWDHTPPLDARSDTYRHAYRQRQSITSTSSSMDMGHYSDEGIIRTLAVYHVTRYSRPILQIDVTVLRSVDAEIGSLLSLTSAHVPINGLRGVDALTCMVVARRLLLDEGVIRLRLWAVGAVYGRVGLIAPTAKISAWDAGTNTYTLEPNAFTTGSVDDYPTDTAGFAVGDHIDLCERSYAVRVSDQTITAVGANTITVALAPKSTPNAGDILRLASYENQPADGLTPWAWLWDTALTWTPYNWTT